MTSNGGTSDPTDPDEALEQPGRTPSGQIPTEENTTPEETTQVPSNGNETLSDPEEVLGKPEDEAHSSQTQEHEDPSLAVTLSESSNGKGEPQDTLQTRIQMTTPLPDVYSDTGIVPPKS